MPSGEFVQSLDMRSVPSERRNPVVADLFQRLRLMERRGSGFKKIIGAYQAESQKRKVLRSPEFRSTAKNFFVIMPNLNYGTNLVGGKKTTQKTTQESTQKTTQKSTQKIIVAIANNPNVTRQELSDIIGITQDGIKKALDGLKRKGLIRRVGPDKGGHWEIVKR